MRNFNPKWIIGKTIARVEMNPFDAGAGRGQSTDPLIVFDDGSCIAFIADETEGDSYGVRILYTPASRSRFSPSTP